MRYGRGAMPKGFLPVFSVNTEEEAQKLLTATCQTNTNGEFYSRELAHDQTLETLQAFSNKLADVYERMTKRG